MAEQRKGAIIARNTLGETYDSFIGLGFITVVLRLTSTKFISELQSIAGCGIVFSLISLSMLALMLLAVPFCIIRRPKRCAVFIVAAAAVFGLNCLFYPETVYMIAGEADSLLINLAVPCIICMAVDTEKLWRYVKLCGYIGAALAFVMTLLFILHRNSLYGTASYDMSYSYAVTVPALILAATFFAEGNIINMLLSLALLVFTVKYGARGPVLCYAVGLVLMVITYIVLKLGRKDVRTETVAKQNFKVALCAAVLAVLIVVAAFSVMKTLGIKTGIRSVDAMLADKGSDSGRTEYHYIPALSHIADESILAGDGLFSDRPYLYNYIRLAAPQKVESESSLYGCYCHNIVLELMFHFGAIFGLVIAGLLLWMVIKAFCRDGVTKWALCIFAAMSCALMVSESYLRYSCLWILTGLCINIITKRGKQYERAHCEY